MPVTQLTVRMDGSYHAGHDVITPQDCPADIQDCLPRQEGQMQRCLQEKATKNSYRQSGQRTRANPSRGSPQSRKSLTALRTTGLQSRAKRDGLTGAKRNVRNGTK